MKIQELEDLRSRLRRVQVLVIGDVMLDEYLTGSAGRISPEAPVPVVNITRRAYLPGGAANVAANVVSLGAQVRLLGVCGSDANATMLRGALARAGVGSDDLIACDSRPTISKTRVIAGQQQIVRYDFETRSDLPADVTAHLNSSCACLAGHADICVLSDYGKSLLNEEFCANAIRIASGFGKPVIVDPKGRAYRKYAGCTLITPNLKEAGEAANLPIESDADLFAAGTRLLRQLPGSSVLITRGPDGMTLFEPERAPMTIPTVARQVFDVVGAGDTVAAALGIALGSGWPIETGIKLANLAAGIAVGKHGTVAVSLAELVNHPEADDLFTELAALT